MINKYQQGGKLDAIMLFVLGLALVLLADPNQIIQIAQQNPDALKSAVQVFQQTQDMNQAAQAFQQTLQQQVKAAKHGAKLNYIKSLKNQCAEDEEVVYYKKGGSVGCGCKKKEDSGKVKQAKSGCKAIEKFKALRMQSGGKKTVSSGTGINSNTEKKEGWDNKGNYIVTKKGIAERKKQLEANKNEEGQADPNKKKPQPKAQPKQPVKKGCNGIVAKFKMHRLGGSLNGIPFIKKVQIKGE